MYIVFWCSNLLEGRCCIELQLNSSVKIVLSVASICYILCCLVNFIGISKFGMFWTLYLFFVSFSL